MKINKPLCEAVFNYEKEKVYPLHTPGHKGGRGMDKSLLAALGKRAAAIDVSLMSELDDIHCPEGCCWKHSRWRQNFMAVTGVFLQ